MDFDPIAAAKAAKQDIKALKARHYKKRTSKLEPFRHEIAGLHREKNTLEVIQNHLWRVHYLKTSRSTILRYLRSIGLVQRG